MDTPSFLTMTVALFAITGSIAITPIFVGVIEGQSNAQRRKTALIAAATYVVAGVIALFLGHAALSVFGISVAALRATGMAIVAMIGWKMLNAATPVAPQSGAEDGSALTRVHHHVASNIRVVQPQSTGTAASPASVGIMPLGFPIYGGPGVISVIIAWGSGAKPVYLSRADRDLRQRRHHRRARFPRYADRQADRRRGPARHQKAVRPDRRSARGQRHGGWAADPLPRPCWNTLT